MKFVLDLLRKRFNKSLMIWHTIMSLWMLAVIFSCVMSFESWNCTRGYVDTPTYFHLDSAFLFHTLAAGIKQHILVPPALILHPLHARARFFASQEFVHVLIAVNQIITSWLTLGFTCKISIYATQMTTYGAFLFMISKKNIFALE